MKPFLIYIACPYTIGDVAQNVKRASHLFQYIADTGFMPFNPLLSHFQHMMFPREYNWWLEYDLQIIKRCDAMVRIIGESKGADQEEKFAGENGIPVHHFKGFDFESLDSLDNFLTQLKGPQE